ncbi:putative nuclease HARBI1 [Oryzias melastigma]|uniref:Putative nuclease HARBI1 n=1 Tax=Oryzias melastigma TaxID=30732 RepID=A0A834F5C5_ORYME|nr:putative nuclease HARBI1 [Oryzias melastigma]
MAISIAVLDCDLLLHGRGHKTLDRFDLDSVSDDFLLTHFSFPRDFILYLVELLREYSPERSSSILLACCVLHNVSLQSGLDAWTLERTEPLEEHRNLKQRPEDDEAEELRKQLILKHFS